MVYLSKFTFTSNLQTLILKMPFPLSHRWIDSIFFFTTEYEKFKLNCRNHWFQNEDVRRVKSMYRDIEHFLSICNHTNNEYVTFISLLTSFKVAIKKCETNQKEE